MLAQYRLRQQAENDEKQAACSKGAAASLVQRVHKVQQRTLRRMERRHMAKDWRVTLADSTAAWRARNPRP